MHSLSNYLGSIADTLVEHGHNVTSLIPTYSSTIKDGTKLSHIRFVDVAPDIRAEYNAMMSSITSFFMEPLVDLRPIIFPDDSYTNYAVRHCENVLKDTALLEELANEKYDAYIMENFDFCAPLLVPIIKPKSHMIVTSCALFGELYDDLGIPQHVSYNPAMSTTALNPHSIVDRAWNIVSDMMSRTYFNKKSFEELFKRKFGANYPTVKDITSHSAYVFENIEPLLNFAHPTLTKVIAIGGIGARKPQTLAKEWLQLLSVRDRTVLISFGSLLRSDSLHDDQKIALLKTIEAFPAYTFIWKYENTTDDFAMKKASKVVNLHLTSWMPQNDLLNHEKVVAFITHAGGGSTNEAARRGVPGLFIPIFFDQPRNAYMMERAGLGVTFDKFRLNDASALMSALRLLLNNSTYHRNAKAMAHKLARKPFSAEELLVRHVEFAARFGPSEALRPESTDMTLVELHNLDIIAMAILSFALVTYAAHKCLRMIFRYFIAQKQKQD